ncbi:MAG: hypothetical protein E5W64_04995, partial [Mesorhizobium sp.]
MALRIAWSNWSRFEEVGGILERSSSAVEGCRWSLALLSAALGLVLPTPAFAHASDRGHVLL